MGVVWLLRKINHERPLNIRRWVYFSPLILLVFVITFVLSPVIAFIWGLVWLVKHAHRCTYPPLVSFN